MINAINLSKTYVIKQKESFWKKPIYLSKEAVKNLSMQIDRGKITGLLGINGAGKTTTIKMLSTMLSPSSGSLYIDDLDAIRYPLKAKSRLNIITGGERNIYWRLTARENLEYFGSLYGLDKANLNQRINQLQSANSNRRFCGAKRTRRGASGLNQ